MSARDRSAAAAGLSLRRLTDADLTAAAAVMAAAFGVRDSTVAERERRRRRVAHLLATDPDASWLVEADGAVAGVAQAYRRDRVWCLSLLAVDPGAQSAGAGRLLLDATLRYRREDDSGLIVSSNDPRALRLYARAGFALHPGLETLGQVDRRALRRSAGEVRDGAESDLEALEPISRAVRGAPHTPELGYALGRGARLLLHRSGDGFAVLQPGFGVWMLVAREEAVARVLLWSALAELDSSSGPVVRWITGAQQWAIDVVTRAGLRLSAYGALCVSGTPGPLAPFLPSPPFA